MANFCNEGSLPSVPRRVYLEFARGSAERNESRASLDQPLLGPEVRVIQDGTGLPCNTGEPCTQQLTGLGRAHIVVLVRNEHQIAIHTTGRDTNISIGNFEPGPTDTDRILPAGIPFAVPGTPSRDTLCAKFVNEFGILPGELVDEGESRKGGKRKTQIAIKGKFGRIIQKGKWNIHGMTTCGDRRNTIDNQRYPILSILSIGDLA